MSNVPLTMTDQRGVTSAPGIAKFISWAGNCVRAIRSICYRNWAEFIEHSPTFLPNRDMKPPEEFLEQVDNNSGTGTLRADLSQIRQSCRRWSEGACQD